MRIGIFGGSFDPVHNEHINIVKNAIKEFKLDKLVVLVANNPPHKENVSSFSTRFNQAKLAFSDIEKVEVSDYENNGKVNYAYEALEHFSGNDELFYIIGADSLFYFDTWKNIERIFELSTLIVLPRHNYPIEKAKYESKGAKILVSSYETEDISSTMLRVYLDFGLDVSSYIPSKAYEYIKDNPEYRKHRKALEQLKQDVKPERYVHSANTTVMALNLNSKFKIDTEKVYVAAMLHDSGKNIEKYKYLIKDEFRDVNYKVVHQYVGREVAKTIYGIKDEEILNAINYHTTGKDNMTDFERLIYLSDAVCLGRDYEGVEELRKQAFEDFDGAFKFVIEYQTESHLEEQDPLAMKAYNYYVKGVR